MLKKVLKQSVAAIKISLSASKQFTSIVTTDNKLY